MDSINNNTPDIVSKPSGLAVGILAAFGSSVATDSLTQKLFANFLSQIQTPSPPPANPQTPSASPSQKIQQFSQQDTETNDLSDNQITSNAPATNASAPTHKGGVLGKTRHRNNKTETNTSKPHKTNDGQSTSPSSQTIAADNQTNTTPTAPATTADAAASDPDNATGNENDFVAAAALANDPDQGTNVQTASVPTGAAKATSTPTLSGSSQSNNAESNGDNTLSPLMLLLLQLERLAVSQSNNASVAAAAPAKAATVQNANADATQPLSETASQTPEKVDLKGLLAELNAANSITNNQTDTATNNNAQNTPASSSSAASAQNILSPSNTTPVPDAVNDKWMNASFLNLFNSAPNNQTNINVPLPINPGIATGAAANIGGDASLDTNMQDQAGTNTRNAGTDIQAPELNLQISAGPSHMANPYDFASQLSAMRAAKGGPTGLPTPVEQVMFQLSRGLSKDGASQMTIQLRPAELGRVDVKLNISSDGKVQGTVTADNPTTLNLLLKDARGLERALQEAGLSADSGSLQFSLRGDGQAGNSYNQASNQPGVAGNDSASLGSSIVPISADAVETYYLTPGGVNLHV